MQGTRLHIPHKTLVILDDIRIDFKKDSKTGAYEHGNYLVPTQTEDRLPAEIRGKATFHQWTYQYSNSYEVWDGNKPTTQNSSTEPGIGHSGTATPENKQEDTELTC